MHDIFRLPSLCTTGRLRVAMPFDENLVPNAIANDAEVDAVGISGASGSQVFEKSKPCSSFSSAESYIPPCRARASRV